MFRSVITTQYFVQVINYIERLDDLYRTHEWTNEDQASAALALVHALSHTEGMLRVRIVKTAAFIEDRYPEKDVQEAVGHILDELSRENIALSKGEGAA